MELMVVVVIVGVLATLGLSQYGGWREKTLDKEAQANLRLILAAERIAKLEESAYKGPYTGVTAIEDINTNLRLLLPRGTNPNWNYSVLSCNSGAGFTAQAQRTYNGNTRYFCIDSPTTTITDPDVRASTSPCACGS